MPSENQKFGSRKTRVEPTSVEEAIIAAQGLAKDPSDLIQIAAVPMGMPEEDIRSLVARKLKWHNREVVGRFSVRATVVVERRSRRGPISRGRWHARNAI